MLCKLGCDERVLPPGLLTPGSLGDPLGQLGGTPPGPWPPFEDELEPEGLCPGGRTNGGVAVEVRAERGPLTGLGGPWFTGGPCTCGLGIMWWCRNGHSLGHRQLNWETWSLDLPNLPTKRVNDNHQFLLVHRAISILWRSNWN